MKENIRKYYLYNFFRDLAFFAPVIVLFWQSRGLNMTQIMILQSIYAIAVVILELPTGAFADYFGKRKSLILGTFSFALASFYYAFGFKFWQFVISEIMAALGMAFVSGADSAFIHETLKSIGRELDYKKVEGRTQGFRQIAHTLGSLIGGFIGSFSLAFTLIATGIASLVASVIGYFFARTKEKLPREEKTEYLKIIKESLIIIKNNRRLLWLTLFFAAFNSLVWTVNWFSQPYLQMLKVPVVYFGVIFAAFSVVTAIGSALVYRFEKVTRGRPFLVMSLIASISMLLLGLMPRLYVFPLWSLFMTFAVMNRTLVSDQVLALVPSERAATILSFQNLLRRFIYAGFGPILGITADKFGILIALQLNAVVLFLTLGLLRFSRRKIITVR
jgi:MFS family permease